jgi:hypothetical protein
MKRIEDIISNIENKIFFDLKKSHSAISKHLVTLRECLIERDILSIIKTVSEINHTLLELGLDPVDYFYDKELSKKLKEIEGSSQLSAPKGVFFLWIGDIPETAFNYIDFWKNSTSEPISLWYDSNFLLAGRIKEIIKKTCSKHMSEIEKQDYFHSKIKRKIEEKNISGDNAIINYVESFDKKLAEELRFDLDKVRSKYEDIKSIVVLKSIQKSDFLSREYYDFYITEITLRNNLAAASDISRLCLLYKYGGTYVDVDTLPPLDHVFARSNDMFGKELINRDIIDIFKSKLVIDKINNKNFYKDKAIIDNNKIYQSLKKIDPQLPDIIVDDVIKASKKDIYANVEMKKVDSNLISISSSPNIVGDFNNNIISSHPKSKILRIILKELKRRYRYIISNGFDTCTVKGLKPGNNDYYNRMMNYRFDSFGNNAYVTLISSGPTLLLEVILGISYEILNIDHEKNQVGVSLALQLPHIGIGYTDQTMYTYEHIKSSWMSSDDIEQLLF